MDTFKLLEETNMTFTKQDIPQPEIQGFDETDSTSRQDKA